jgi:predicted DNA-binding protein
MSGMKKDRKQINIRLEQELHDFLVKYAQDNYKTVTAVVRELIVGLKKDCDAK